MINRDLISSPPSNYHIGDSENSFDIRTYFFIAIATQETGRDFIIKKYNEDKWTYFQAYKESEFKDNPALTCYSVEVEEIIRMLIGMYEVSERTGDTLTLHQIIKKSYNNLYRYVSNKQMFDEDEYRKYSEKKSRTGQIDIRAHMYAVSVAVFLCYQLKKNVSLSIVFVESMFGISDTPNTPEKREEYWNENSNNIQEAVKELEEKYQINLPKKPDSLWGMISAQMRTAEELYEHNPESAFKLRDVVQERINGVTAMGDMLETFGLDPIEIQNRNYEPDLFRKLFQEYVMHIQDHKEHIPFNLFYSLYYYLYSLTDMYLGVKSYLLDTTEEEKFILTKEKEEELAKREREFQKIEEKAEKDNKHLSERNTKLQEELDILRKKNLILEKENEEMRINKKELSALRSFIYKIEQNSNEHLDSLEQTTQRLNELKSKSFVFFGGHPKWIQKVKEILPEARFLGVEDINRKLSFIQQYDIICINTTHFNHGFYYKLMNEIGKYSVELVYISSTNAERIIDDLYEQVYDV